MGKLGEKIMFYSQVGQDKWVIDFFKNKKTGYFIEIGANDGINLSNTYALETSFNWDGLCIEGDPKIFVELEKNRKCKCLNYFVSNKEEEIVFIQEGLTGRAYTSNDKSLYPKINLLTKTMDKILEENNCPLFIDYISLDVEGFESKVLEKIPFEKYTIGLMTIEHNLYLGDDTNKKAINEIMIANNFILYKENVEDKGLKFEDWYMNKNL